MTETIQLRNGDRGIVTSKVRMHGGLTPEYQVTVLTHVDGIAHQFDTDAVRMGDRARSATLCDWMQL